MRDAATVATTALAAPAANAAAQSRRPPVADAERLLLSGPSSARQSAQPAAIGGPAARAARGDSHEGWGDGRAAVSYLQPLGLERYAAAFDDEGFEDATALRGMSHDALVAELGTQMMMSGDTNARRL